MKTLHILALAAVPAICVSLTSCSRSAADVMTEACDIIKEASEALSKATPANAKDVADEINSLAEDMEALAKYTKENNEALEAEANAMTPADKEKMEQEFMAAAIAYMGAHQKAQESGAFQSTELTNAIKRFDQAVSGLK
ncbi:MAG: hypothetical protein IJA63_08655 [Akkermansia sp.]|nr:hypothetical protein [Akkermansia sp.]